VRVLIVDDSPTNVDLLCAVLSHQGYAIAVARDGEQALEYLRQHAVDIVVLDILMPGLSGIEVCRRIRSDPRHAMLPVVLVTALDPEQERVHGLDAGADDFISKPVNREELLARVRSLVRVKQLFDRTEAQARELARLNADLERMVAQKVEEIARLSKLKRFVAPNLAERILAGHAEDPLRSHRRDIVVVFLDLRGFTAFSETSAPEDVMALLREYHERVGVETQRYRGTIERFAGDGIMVFFNDPEPVAAPCEAAVRYAASVLSACRPVLQRWRQSGFDIDLSAGLAYGYATLGAIGFADRQDYGAIGTVTNLAARLCAEARGGEILLSARVAASLPAGFETVAAGPFALKGFRDPVPACALVAAPAIASAAPTADGAG
jgi:class 3 adenylate cyclase